MYIYIFFPYPNIGLSSLSLFYVAALSFFPVFSLFYIQPYLFFPFPLLTYNLALSFLCLFVFRVRYYCFFFPRYRFLHKTLSFFFFIFFPCPMILLCLFSFRRRRIFQEKLSEDAKKKHIKGAHFSHFLQNFFSLSHVLLALRSVRMYGCSRSKECLYV